MLSVKGCVVCFFLWVCSNGSKYILVLGLFFFFFYTTESPVLVNLNKIEKIKSRNTTARSVFFAQSNLVFFFSFFLFHLCDIRGGRQLSAKLSARLFKAAVVCWPDERWQKLSQTLNGA